MSPSALTLRNRLCLLAAVAVACGGQESAPLSTSTATPPTEAGAGSPGVPAGTGGASSGGPGDLAGSPAGAPANHAGHNTALAGTHAQAGKTGTGGAGTGGAGNGGAGGIDECALIFWPSAGFAGVCGVGSGGEAGAPAGTAGVGGAEQGGVGGAEQGGEAGAAGNTSPPGIPATWDFYDCYDASQTPAGMGKCAALTEGELLNKLLVIPFCGVIEGPAVVASPEGDRCCYQIPPCVGGRPLVLEEGLRHAQIRGGAAWS